MPSIDGDGFAWNLKNVCHLILTKIIRYECISDPPVRSRREMMVRNFFYEGNISAEWQPEVS